MSVLVAEKLALGRAVPAQVTFPIPTDGPEERRSTLEDVVLVAWEDLRLHGATECPVCSCELVRGGCTECGAELT